MLQQHQPQPLLTPSPHVVGDPFFPTVGQRRDRWELQKTLGSGGFGTVTLWKNEETEEEIAIKKCRLAGNMSVKNCKRWRIEVDIMKRLRHENVVSGVNVPPGLASLQDDLPLLAMEYCSGGDLRKVLNNPKNCCGVTEYEVRWLAYDISAAVEYLHSNRIIHRDLKPENIVLQPTEERTVYKLIDLGYAKELDQSSVCQSFVGTLQYLAPELYIGQKYTQTVDYWSFGTVMFEALTGTRPFLPNSPPLQWHNEVKQKSQDDICAYFGNDGSVKFTKKLLSPNHLTKTMQKYFEDWLRQMLRWDPKTRGGGLSSERRQNCFLLLERILSIKISNILYVETNQLISVPVSSQQTMHELQRIIEQETRVPINDQDLLLASGLTPDFHKPAIQCWSEPHSIEELLVFLFRKSETSTSVRKDKQPPLPVQYIIKEPKVMLSYAEQRKAWAQSVYFCQEQNRDFHRLIGSQRAAMLSLLRANSEFVRLKNQMSAEVGQMLARKDQFKESLELDMTKYEDQKDLGIRSDQTFSKWEKTADEIEKYNNLKDNANKLDQDASVLQTRIVELQKSPFARGKNYTHLAECEDKAKNLYGELRQAGKDNRNDMLLEHTLMVDAVTKCLVYRNKAVAEMMLHISKICSCRTQLDQLLPNIRTCCEEINAACKQLVSHQKNRQNDIWNFLKIALQKNLSRSNSRKISQSRVLSGSQSGPACVLSGSQSGPACSSPISSTPSGGLNFNQTPSLAQPQSINRYDSRLVIKDSSLCTQRMNEVMASIMTEQQESMLLTNSLDELLHPRTSSSSIDPQLSNLTPRSSSSINPQSSTNYNTRQLEDQTKVIQLPNDRELTRLMDMKARK